MKLITKVVALEATKLLLTVIIVVFGIYGLRGIGDNLRAISHSDIPLMVSISKITAAQIEQSLWLQKVVLETEFGDAIAAEEASLKYGELSDQVTAEITQVVQFVKAILEKENNELDKNKFQQLLASLRKIESDYDNYTNIAIRLLVLIRQNDEAALKAQLPEAQILVESMSNDLQKLNASIARSTEIRALGAEQDESVATNTMIFVSLIALALALVLGIFIARNISKRFGCDPTKLERMAALVAEGRLEIERDAMAEGVYGAISRTVENLTKIIRGIKAGAKEVSAAAEQVFQGNLNLSQRTQEQASSLEQVAASMEQMIGTTNQNADNALQASKLADSAREIADKGKKIVDDTVAAMDIINDSSGQIANIIGVIEELAFQTNLLALNATVEAARAGESGRGFAVVAAEVKNLAGRSAKASNDIKTLIKSSVEKVIDGTKMAGLSGDALSEIVAAVDNVSKIVKEIAAASQEQSQGIGQVNKALMQMDEMTQQNAALVEQASATSEAMGAQAEKLSDLVSYFKIKNDSVTYTGAIKRITINEQERSSGYKKQPVSRFAEVTSKTSTADFSDDDGRWTEF